MDLPCVVNSDAGGYTVRLTLPATLLLADRKEFGFEIKVDDAESAGGKTVREAGWVNGETPFRNRLAFGIVQTQP